MPDVPDKPKTPPTGTRRLQSQTERDMSGLAAKAIRESAHHAIPVEVDEDITGKHEGDPDELARLRAKRPTDKRIGRLEEKHDTLSADVGEIKVDIGDIKGQMKVWPELVAELRASNADTRERETATFTATVEVGKAAGLADVKVKETARLAKIDIYKTLALKVIAGVIALVGAALIGREL